MPKKKHSYKKVPKKHTKALKKIIKSKVGAGSGMGRLQKAQRSR